MTATPTKRWEVDKINLTDHRTGKEYIIPLFEERATKHPKKATKKKTTKKTAKKEKKPGKAKAKAAKKPKAAKGTGKRTARAK